MLSALQEREHLDGKNDVFINLNDFSVNRLSSQLARENLGQQLPLQIQQWPNCWPRDVGCALQTI